MSARIFNTVIDKVRGTYGAPMGRASWGRPKDCQGRSIHLFHVPLDRYGYDSGGAYWGIGQRLYCAYAHEDYCDFVRADTREAAAKALELDNTLLISPLR